MPRIVGAIAIWLIVAPFLLGYAESVPAVRNDVGVGIVMLIGAITWGLSGLRHSDIRVDHR